MERLHRVTKSLRLQNNPNHYCEDDDNDCDVFDDVGDGADGQSDCGEDDDDDGGKHPLGEGV